MALIRAERRGGLTLMAGETHGAPPKAILSEWRAAWPLTLRSGQVFNIPGYILQWQKESFGVKGRCISAVIGFWPGSEDNVICGEGLGRGWTGVNGATATVGCRWGTPTRPAPELLVPPGVRADPLGMYVSLLTLQKLVAQYPGTKLGAGEAALVALCQPKLLKAWEGPVHPFPRLPPPLPAPWLLHYSLPPGRRRPAWASHHYNYHHWK